MAVAAASLPQGSWLRGLLTSGDTGFLGYHLSGSRTVRLFFCALSLVKSWSGDNGLQSGGGLPVICTSAVDT